MYPEVEAHKVIAISLGKIASSRIQRGGPKLYKNLLVANLIQKARVFFVDEPQSAEYLSQQTEEQTEEEICPVGEQNEKENASKNDPDVKPLQLTLNLGEDAMQEEGCSERGSEWDENDKENNRPPRQEDVTSETKIIPLRCLKRRNHTSSTEEEEVKRHKNNQTDSKFKRWRRTSITSCLSDTDSDSEETTEYSTKIPSQVNLVFSVELHSPDSSSDSSSSSPMDTEQITNLTSVFNNSFRGLGSADDRKSNLERRTSCDDTSKQLELVVCSKQAASILKVSFPSNKPLALAV